MTALPVSRLRLSEPGDSLAGRSPASSTGAAAPSPEWVQINDAAPLMGVTVAHLRRQCGSRHFGKLAQLMTPVGGGKKSWHLHRSTHPSLVRATVAPCAESDESPQALALRELREAPQAKRDEASLRAQLLIAFRRWRVRPGVHVRRDYTSVAETLARSAGLRRPVSLSQLYEWDRIAPASDHVTGVAAALLDRRRGPLETTSASPDAWALFEELYLTPQQWSISKCHRQVAAAARVKGWSWPGIRQVTRLVADRIPPTTRDFHRLGAGEWAKKHQAPYEQDPEAFSAGECWEADHSNLDFFVRVLRGGKWVAARPWLTAWFDRRTRLAVGWRLSMEHDSYSIRLALIDALGANGHSAPRYAWLDNGKDFASHYMIGATKAERRRMTREEIDAARAHQRGLLASLEIEAHFAVPYNHNGKARIERWFGTVHMDFDRTFPSWCGSKPGDVDPARIRAACDDVMKLPTVEEAAEKFAAWARGYNLRSEHAIADLVDDSGERLSPLAFYERHLPARRIVSGESLELLQRPWSRPLKVTKRGVRLIVDGEAWYYGECTPELEALVGTDRRVMVSYDPSSMNAVSVHDEAGRFLCRAELNQRHGGVSDEPLRREALKAGRARRKAQRQRAAMKHDLSAVVMTDAELAIAEQRRADIAREEARIRAEGGKAPAAPVRLVRTPVDGQSKAVKRAEHRRLAAGAEGAGSGRDIVAMLQSESFAEPSAPRSRDVLRLTGAAVEEENQSSRDVLAVTDDVGEQACSSVRLLDMLP